jgi:hypothetical protein
LFFLKARSVNSTSSGLSSTSSTTLFSMVFPPSSHNVFAMKLFLSFSMVV